METNALQNFQKWLRKYRRLQYALLQANDSVVIRRLQRKLDLIGRRILRLNKHLKLGFTTATLLAWMHGAAIGQTFPPVLDVSTLDGTNGFLITGAPQQVYAGVRVSELGDINGDGFSDIGIGAYLPSVDDTGGSAYVIFGSAGMQDSIFSLSNLSSNEGFLLTGVAGNVLYSEGLITSAGDFNGDGFDDILMGAPYVGADDKGVAYLLFGKSSGFPDTLDVNNLNVADGFTIPGLNSDDYVGAKVSAAGDINNDGFDDLIIGGIGVSPTSQSSEGAIYVVFGNNGNTTSTFDLSTLDGSNGFSFRVNNAAYSIGNAFSQGGDINGDGIDDIILGNYSAYPSGNFEDGETYVVFGQTSGFPDSLNNQSLDGNNGFAMRTTTTEGLGHIVNGGKDINGDGIADWVMEPYEKDNESYVVFGQSTPWTPLVDISSLDGTNGFFIKGPEGYGEYQQSVISLIDDINGDGIDDFTINEAEALINSERLGKVHLVFGKTTGWTDTLDVENLDGMNGFVLTDSLATPGGYGFGLAVSSIGDFNGDGANDLCIGSLSDPGGKAYIIFGQGTSTSVDRDQVLVDIQIAPNPAPGQFSLKSSQAIIESIALYDLAGRQILPAEIINDRHEAQVLSSYRGLVIVKVQTNQGPWIQKVLLE